MSVDTGLLLKRLVAAESAISTLEANDRVLVLPAIATATAATVADGKFFFIVPAELNGLVIKEVRGCVASAGVASAGETMDVQLRNVTQTADILSTKLQFAEAVQADNGAAVIDTDEDDLTTGDVIAVDVDQIHAGTAADGLTITLVVGPAS